jgi:ankyrin repeat protein
MLSNVTGQSLPGSFKPGTLSARQTQHANRTIKKHLELWNHISDAFATGVIVDEDLPHDLPIQMESQDTPLHIAIAYGKIQLVSKLLHLGASLASKNLEAFSPLLYAAELRRWDIVQMVVEEHSLEVCDPKDMGRLLLMLLAAKLVTIAKIIIEKNIPYDPCCQLPPENRSLLHVAVLDDSSLEICVDIINKGASLSAQDAKGDTPLHLAIANDRSVPFIEALLARKFNVNAKNKKGETPLHIAVKNDKRSAIVSCLLEAGADITIHDNSYEINSKGCNPIQLAGYSTSFTCVQLLMKYAPKDVKNDQILRFGSALIYAVYQKQFRLAQELINNLPFIDTNHFINGCSNTTLHLAIANDGPISLIKALLSRKAKVNAKNTLGKTPLHVAIEIERIDIISCLLKAGADIAICDAQGITPLHLACRSNDVRCLDPFLSTAMPKDEINLIFSYALLEALQHRQFAMARKILLWPALNFKCLSPETLGNALHVATEAKAPLDIINGLVHKYVSYRAKDKDGHTPLEIAMHLGHLPIARILQEPKNYERDCSKLQEFFLLHRLGHGNISRIPKDFLNLIGHYCGHDKMYIQKFLDAAEESYVELDNEFKLIVNGRNPNEKLKDKEFAYHALDEYYYTHTTWGMNIGLQLLHSLPKLWPASLLTVLRVDPYSFRLQEIDRLSHLSNKIRGL